jgi:hypothetical protein
VLAVFASSPIASQTSPSIPVAGPDFQSWDELDVLTRMRPHLDVTWISRVRLSEELPNPARLVFGTDWNFSVRKNLVLTPSFYHVTFHITSGAAEHRKMPILAIMPTFSRGNWTVSERSRIGRRFDTNAVEPSWFYRNRPESTTESETRSMLTRSLHGMRSTIFRNTMVGPETELRPADTEASVSGSRLIFTISARITPPAASLHTLIQLRSSSTCESDGAPLQQQPGEFRRRCRR